MKRTLLTISAFALSALVSYGQTIYLDEDFESGFPSGWTQTTVSNDGGWNAGNATSLSSTSFPIEEHGNIIATNDDDCNCDKSADSLFTDTIDLTSATGLLVLQYDLFYVEGTYQGATESLDFYVYSVSNQTWTQEFDAPTEAALAWKDGQFLDLSSYAGDEIVIAFVYNDGSGWTFGAALDNVTLFEAAQYNVSNVSVDNSPYTEVNTSADIIGEVVNLGSETITALQMAYIVDGGTPVIGSLTGLSIAPLESHSYTHPTQWTPNMEQTSEVITAVVMINGNLDADNSNDTASTDVLVHPTAVDRKPLIESYTSSTCGPCVQGNINVGSVLENFVGEYSKVNYQMSWPGNGDPYFTDEAGVRRTYHGVNSVPNVFTDGVDNGNSQSYTASIVDDALEVPAFVDIEIPVATIRDNEVYEMQGGELVLVETQSSISIEADFTPIISIPSGQVAHIAVIENLTDANIGTNGETEFEFVMKKMIPNANGTPLAAIPATQTFTHSGSWDIQGEYRLPNDANDPIDHLTEHSIEEMDDLSVVVWLEDQGANEVWQSENASIVEVEATTNVVDTTINGLPAVVVDGETYVEGSNGSYEPLGISNAAKTAVAIYPNPANSIINIAGLNGTITVAIYDLTGRVALQSSTSTNSIDVSELSAGVYNVEIQNEEIRVVQKITVVK